MSMGLEADVAPQNGDDRDEWEWLDEGLFVRDVNGRLIRYDAATRAELDKKVKLKIDGKEIDVKKAVVATDAQGNPKRDANGEIIPRPTTIYDAVSERYRGTESAGTTPGPPFGSGPADGNRLPPKPGDPNNPIPILCHTMYMDPVAVCRLCVVQLARYRRRTNKVEVDDKLLPACQHRVEAEMIVDTIASPDEKARTRIESAVKTLLALLLADHPVNCVKEQEHSGSCELEALARRFNVTGDRFKGRAQAAPVRGSPRIEVDHWPHDVTSPVIAVDHSACILCDRCVRGCDIIKENHVIGRMGKGYTARIAFDLDESMGRSSCVACGECADDCPTGALTHREVVATGLTEGRTVEVDDLIGHLNPNIQRVFAGMSRPFLRWNIHAVKRRDFRKGDLICEEGKYGATAFFIERGSVEIFLRTPNERVENRPASSFWAALGRFRTRLSSRPEDRTRDYIPIDAPVALAYDHPQATLKAGDIFGEMTCMSNYPRSATVRAAEDCTVLEVLRNVLYIMQRNPAFRRELEASYRSRAIDDHLRSVSLFAPLRHDEDHFRRVVDMLRPRVSLQRCEPGEVILRQGAPAVDGLYLVRTGFVKVSQARPGGERVLNYVGPGGYVGEIGVLSELPELRDLAPSRVRTATCTALDHVELVRITPDDFRTILEQAPAVRAAVVAEARERLLDNERNLREIRETPLDAFLDQGLQEAQSLLVLDLVKCTRCDECTKACSDTHQGVTRLIREGLRYDRFLVASSCRSCLDPYCMVGCPVGSIRRHQSSEIHIENWCIGCGLCADNCPYGNINMVQEYDQVKKAHVRKATTCDLCTNLGPNSQPSCVYACPHDAAHRMSGTELLDLVREKDSKRK
jgi:CRP-like cAMP-binding protein/Fe-S-cluster-containing dehydrogenase component